MAKGGFYLLDTAEYVTLPEWAAGSLYLKSSAGRKGIEHLHAGWVDPGFNGTLSLEIEVRAPWPVHISRGERLVQLVLHKMAEPPEISYASTGRYSGQRVPTTAREARNVD